ncbi:MAG: NAD(P)/FAD-dependent oxidoreductase [Aquificaceae bacterium]|nr:NAD(P)/FAD-dependent oxidoreductase [Aquificaceae bacterium]
MKKVDVLIVGGGPAGSTCAYELAGKGLKVLVVDTKKKIGTPVQCAEFVPIQLTHTFGEFFPEKAISQRVYRMVHYTPWGEVVSMCSDGYVLNREVFDHHIAYLASKKGVEIMLRTRFLGFEDGVAWIENIENRKRMPVSARFVVGADGPKSKVAKLTGEHTENFLTTSQVTMPLCKNIEDLLIYFRDYIPGGYGWVFPKGKVANVGVGIDTAYNLKVTESLKMFMMELIRDGVVEEMVLKRTGGWIPADGLLAPIRGNVLLVGDAGGFCHPITGGGIANAVLSGSMAGKAILKEKPEEFEEEAIDVFESTLRRASEKRKRYMKSWDNLKEIIPKTWIAFEEYWRII